MKELAEDKDEQDEEERDTIEESSMHFSVPKNDLSVDAQPSCESIYFLFSVHKFF